MKTNLKYTAIALLAMGSIFTSCEKSDLAPSNPATLNTDVTEEQKMELNRAKIVGRWKVEAYNEQGEDQTSQFNGWVITFQRGGRLSATNGETTVQGRWNRNMGILNIEFGNALPYGDLTNKWHLGTVNDTRAEMKAQNGNSTDYLILVR
jgi:hypothetical protein